VKILLIAGFSDSIIKFRGSLIQALIDFGLEVHVAAPFLSKNELVSKELESMGVYHHDIPLNRTGLNPLADMYLLYKLFRLIRVINPSFTLGYTIKPVIYGSIAAWAAGVPKRFSMITGLGNAFSSKGSNNKLKKILTSFIRYLYSLAMSKAHLVIFQNPDDEEAFRKLKLLDSSVPSVVVNGSGVDLSLYSVAPAVVSPVSFLLVSRLLGDKGIREYATAAKKIKILNPSVEFHLVGWIDENSDAIYKNELDTWINDNVITFHGRLDDVKVAIAATSVFVLPSYYPEGTPRTILEALSMGRAVITTDMPGCRETVTNGVNGFLVTARSIRELEDAMNEFIRNPQLISTMGLESRKIAEHKYDVNKVNLDMLTAMGLVC
jgi:glycosyltransferase involved in cell wall biosynthesis